MTKPRVRPRNSLVMTSATAISAAPAPISLSSSGYRNSWARLVAGDARGQRARDERHAVARANAEEKEQRCEQCEGQRGHPFVLREPGDLRGNRHHDHQHADEELRRRASPLAAQRNGGEGGDGDPEREWRPAHLRLHNDVGQNHDARGSSEDRAPHAKSGDGKRRGEHQQRLHPPGARQRKDRTRTGPRSRAPTRCRCGRSGGPE